MTNNNATLKYFFAVFIYGTIGYFLHFLDVTSEFVVLCRGTLGSSLILVVLLLRKKKIDYVLIKKKLLIMIISGIALGLNWLFLFMGYNYSVSLSALCNYTAPIIVVVIMAIFFSQKLNKLQVLCILLSFVGITLVSDIFNANSIIDYHALIYGFSAAICFVVLVLCNRQLNDIDPLEKTFVQLMASALTVLPYVLLKDSIPASLDIKSILIILMLGFLHTGVAYIMYFGSISSLDPSRIAIIGYVEPVLSVIIGIVLLNENMSASNLVGGTLIIISALISEVVSNKK